MAMLCCSLAFHNFLGFPIIGFFIVSVWRQTLDRMYTSICFISVSIISLVWSALKRDSLRTGHFFCFGFDHMMLSWFFFFPVHSAHSLCYFVSIIWFPIFQRYWFLRALTLFLFGEKIIYSDESKIEVNSYLYKQQSKICIKEWVLVVRI